MPMMTDGLTSWENTRLRFRLPPSDGRGGGGSFGALFTKPHQHAEQWWEVTLSSREFGESATVLHGLP